MWFGNAVLASGCLALTACGGGGGEVSMGSVSQLDYSNTAAPRHSFTPYETRSHAYSLRLSDDVTEVYIGGDLEPRESLRHVATTRNGIRYQMGAARDGVGVDRLVNYAHDLRTQDDTDPYELDGKGFYPFRVAPKLFVSDGLLEDRNAVILAALLSSIRLLNDALPPEFQIQYMGVREDDGEFIYASPGEIVAILDSPQVSQTTAAPLLWLARPPRFLETTPLWHS